MTAPPGITLRVVDVNDDALLASYCAVINAVTPESPASADEVRWAEATYPGGARWLAFEGRRAVGAAVTGRIHMYPPEFERFWLRIEVLPEARRRGIGGALYAAASDVARAAGKTGFQGAVSERHADGISFLVNRGFEEYERSAQLRLELAGLDAPEPVPPPGVMLTTLAERPELVRGVYGVGLEALPDIPHGGDPTAAGDLAEFVARDVDRSSLPKDAFVVAVEAVTDRVVGYASLHVDLAARPVAWHDMTAVARAWRGRGIARAMKTVLIRWAIEHGLEALETGNDEANAAMRAVNVALGYRPLPDEVSFRGPLAGTPGGAPSDRAR